jgi:NADH dehydrogenase
MAEHAFTLATLEDATVLRSHVLAMLERADLEPDPDARRTLLTFVVAGGGFAGTELVAELHDLVEDVRHLYPGVGAEDPRFVLVHSRDRILPEIGAELAAYALTKLRTRGLEVLLGTRVAAAGVEAVRLDDGRELATRTLVWTAGTRPNPLLETLGVETSRGAVVVGPTLEVVGYPGLWAIGDCARIADPDEPGMSYPPTAQHATREGRAAADAIAAVIRGRAPLPFRFQAIGVLVALGHRTAVAEIRGRQFSGLLAWLMWRGIYLGKLPGLDKKLRVLLDWSIDLVFPRDVVVTEDAGDRTAPTRAVDPGPGVAAEAGR